MTRSVGLKLRDRGQNARDLTGLLEPARRIERRLAERFGPATDVRCLGAAFLHERGAALAAAQRVEGGVHRDSIEPREEIGAAVERSQCAVRAHERLLRRVVGVAVISEDMKCGGVHAALVSPNEATESIPVATPSPFQIGVLVSHGGQL